MSIGSSRTTAGTIGIGLVGIATMLGVSPAIAAGAVIAGAYLGDKISPLSETTILTAQMVEVDLETHIRSQAWTFVIAGDHYIALVLPARIFRVEFERRGLAPQNLSRLTVDSGTVTSPLVPWNSCGAFMGAVLGVATLSYLPFALFNIANPLLSVVYGYTGFKIIKLPSTEKTGDDR